MSENISECDFGNEWLSAMCCGNKGSATPKIFINPFFKNTIIYGKYMSFAKVFIK
jgi:hypothetical protein